MQKPNAILHMTTYGFIYGLLLAMLYIWGWIIFGPGVGNIGLLELIRDFFQLAYMCVWVGALPGAVIGFIEGWILWFIIRGVEPPLHNEDFQKTRSQSFIIIGSLTLLVTSFLVFAIIQLLLALEILYGEIGEIFSLSLPIPIATFAAVYAVYRYFLKLRAWGNVGKAKNKAKHGLTNQLAYEDTVEVEHYLEDEGVTQQKNG